MFDLPISPVFILVGIVGVLVAQKLLFELTTGAQRRRMIRENGCQEPYHYPHEGIMGKLLGLDNIMFAIKSGKERKLLESSRKRLWSRGVTTMRIRQLRKTNIGTIEPENIKAILSIKFQDYSLGTRRKETFIPVFGHGIFDSDGAAWERSRALIRPNFTRQQVADLDMFESHVGHLVNSIPRDGSTVDLQDLFFALTMDSATEFLFGQSTNSLAPGMGRKGAEEFVKAFVYASEAISNNNRSAGLNQWIPDAKYKSSIKTIHKFADDIIQEAIELRRNMDPEKYAASRLASGKQRYLFLHELLDQTSDPYVVRSELLNVLLAGRDTTAGLLSNTWHVLARRPDIWAKVKAEVDELGGDIPDYTRIKEMKYLRYVLSESLRLMPVVPGNSREAIRDTILPSGGGPDGKSPMFVPKGAVVFYSIWSMHRRTDFYGPDALEFRPERWESLRPGWEYLPFNGGPRICIGQQYALLEASYVTIRLMQQFPRIEPRDDRPWCEWIAITLASGNGVKVGLFEH